MEHYEGCREIINLLACKWYDYCRGACSKEMTDLCGQWKDTDLKTAGRLADDREECRRVGREA